MYVQCLADFFNLHLWPSGRDPNYADIRDGLSELTDAALAATEGTQPVTELTVRLYGGWYEYHLGLRVLVRDLTKEVIRTFPGRFGRTRVRVELADSPVWNPSLLLLRTVREVAIRVDPGKFAIPTLCLRGGACSFEQFHHWWNGRCPESNCMVRLRDTGTTKRQKMVDTLLAVDATELARAGDTDAVVVASDDDDMIPVLLAVCSHVMTIRLVRDPSPDAYYDEMLSDLGVTTHVW